MSWTTFEKRLVALRARTALIPASHVTAAGVTFAIIERESDPAIYGGSSTMLAQAGLSRRSRLERRAVGTAAYPLHSTRRAVAGSTRVARLAGSHVASVAATVSTVATIAYAVGSHRLTP